MMVNYVQKERALSGSQQTTGSANLYITDVTFQTDQRAVFVNGKYQGSSSSVQSESMYCLLLFTESVRDAFPGRPVQYFNSKQTVN